MSKLAYYADMIGEHRARTPEGYLIARGVPISRTGWQQYRASELQPSGVPQIDSLSPNAVVNVYRDEADVFEPAAIASFEAKSVTKTHPPGFLTPDNDRQYAMGHAQKVREGGILPNGERFLSADLVIKDAQLIQYIENGLMDEISCGYTYKLVSMDDEHSPDISYRMTEIRGNHVAIVPSGRAGSHVKVLDAALPEEKENTNMEFKDFVDSIKQLGLRLVNDAESDTVNTQHKKDEEALELKNRTMDEEMKEKEEAMDKRVKDAEAKVEEVKKEAAKEKEAVDAKFKQLSDAFEEMKKEKEGKDAKCTCDAEEGEAHDAECPMFKKAEDSDLIPVATLPSSDIPKNPITGADALAIVDSLRKIKPLVADSGDKAAITAFNRAMDAAKRRKPVTDADYATILAAASVEGKDAKTQRERGNVHPINDAAPGSYEEGMRKFHRVDPMQWGKDKVQ